VKKGGPQIWQEGLVMARGSSDQPEARLRADDVTRGRNGTVNRRVDGGAMLAGIGGDVQRRGCPTAALRLVPFLASAQVN
jgi:hypothetical protein